MRYLRVILALVYAVGALLLWITLEKYEWFQQSLTNRWGFIGAVIILYVVFFEYLLPRNGKRK